MLTAYRKEFYWWQQQDIRWDPVLHLIALAVHDNAFESDLTVKRIMEAKLPDGQELLTFQWKAEFRNRPVFRMRGKDGAERELRSSCVAYRVMRLGEQAGLKHKISPYCGRRGMATMLTRKSSQTELSSY